MKLKLNKIYNIDCFIGFRKIEDESIDLIMIDHPTPKPKQFIGFEIDKNYCKIASDRIKKYARK